MRRHRWDESGARGGPAAGAEAMTPREAVALGLAVLLIAGVMLFRIADTRTGIFMITAGLLAIALVVLHQWSR